MKDWLFTVPDSDEGFSGQERLAEEQVRADPEAAAITDDEAEIYFAIAWAFTNIAPSHLPLIARAFGLRLSRIGPKGRRHVVFGVLRQWPDPRARMVLLKLLPNLSIGFLPAASDTGDRFTMEDLVAMCESGGSVVWMVRYVRNLGRSYTAEDYLAALSPTLQREYRFWLNVGRLTQRRLAAEAALRCSPPPGAEQRQWERGLQEQETLAMALQADFVQLEQNRRDLARTACRKESEVADMLEQARSEAAAATEELRRRREEQARERAERESRHAARVDSLHKQLAAARQEFAAALAERGAAAGLAPLRDCTVAVYGDNANTEGYRILVESAGGRLVDLWADLTIVMKAGANDDSEPGAFCTGGSGLAEFERLLHHQILPALARKRA